MADDSDLTETQSKLGEMTIQEKSVSDEQSDTTLVVYEVDVDLNTSNSDLTVEDSINSSEFTFDNIIGHLEDMLIDEDFHKLQNIFLEKYWQEFDGSEENKHSYMEIFKEYTNDIENFINKYLKERIANFDMEKFVIELEERRNTLEGEIFEVLLTLSDFGAFKEILLDYRAMKEGHAIDLGESFSVSSVSF